MSTDDETEKVICDPNETISSIEITSIVIASVSLIIAIPIAITSIKAMEQQTAMRKLLKLLFISSMIALCVYLLGAITITLTCEYAVNGNHIAMVPMTVIILSYCLMALNLLGSLLYRLYITFDESMYRISTMGRYILNGLYTTITFLVILTVAIYASSIPSSVDNVETQRRISYATYCALAAFICYIVTAVIVVSLFAKNMLQLTKLRASSMRNVSQEKVKLNQGQMRFIKQTSRYVSLFSMAMISTVITMSSVALIEISTFEGKAVQLLLISGSIDGTLNMSCLALQYSFANEFYYSYCQWIECCWKTIFVRNTSRSLEIKYATKTARSLELQQLSNITKSHSHDVD